MSDKRYVVLVTHNAGQQDIVKPPAGAYSELAEAFRQADIERASLAYDSMLRTVVTVAELVEVPRG